MDLLTDSWSSWMNWRKKLGHLDNIIYSSLRTLTLIYIPIFRSGGAFFWPTATVFFHEFRSRRRFRSGRTRDWSNTIAKIRRRCLSHFPEKVFHPRVTFALAEGGSSSTAAAALPHHNNKRQNSWKTPWPFKYLGIKFFLTHSCRSKQIFAEGQARSQFNR